MVTPLTRPLSSSPAEVSCASLELELKPSLILLALVEGCQVAVFGLFRVKVAANLRLLHRLGEPGPPRAGVGEVRGLQEQGA